MRILVTGGAGFVGSSLCIFLKKQYPGYSIVAFDNLKRRGSELNLPDFKKLGIEFVHGDICNNSDLELAKRFDVMVDASAEPAVTAGLDTDPSYVIHNNLFGSINCFNACLRNKAKLVFLSTSRVYPIDRIEHANYLEGATRFSFTTEQKEKGISQLGISEDLDLTGARSFYGTTKLSAELFIAEYAEFYGLQTAVTRFGVIAGPRQMGKTDQGVATLWMARHFWKQPLSYIGYGGKGKQVRDFLHIDDAVALIDKQIHNTQLFTGKVYNAGGGLANSLSLQEMTALCEKISGNRIQIESESTNRKADMRIYISDNSKIESETGWKPQKDVETIFSDIYQWISQNESRLNSILK